MFNQYNSVEVHWPDDLTTENVIVYKTIRQYLFIWMAFFGNNAQFQAPDQNLSRLLAKKKLKVTIHKYVILSVFVFVRDITLITKKSASYRNKIHELNKTTVVFSWSFTWSVFSLRKVFGLKSPLKDTIRHCRKQAHSLKPYCFSPRKQISCQVYSYYE